MVRRRPREGMQDSVAKIRAQRLFGKLTQKERLVAGGRVI
jgi:hypothetical protein